MKSAICLSLSVIFLLSAVSCKPRTSSPAPVGEEADFMEYCGIAYSDVVAFIVQGYQCHWDGMDPAEMELSDVYRYESEYCGCCQTDINGDGIPELLLGDQFEDGTFTLYDIFTFDKTSGDIVQLLSGGERDFFVVNSDGIIIETGSNSASDGFIKYYRLEGSQLSESPAIHVGEDHMAIHIDRFIRYVAPNAIVALKDGKLLGQLMKSYDDKYLIEAQDTASVSKTGVSIEVWSAYDGAGVVCLKTPGTRPVYSAPDTSSESVGDMVYESGMCPECYPCKGYRPGWFCIALGKSEAYIQEEYAEWDFTDRH